MMLAIASVAMKNDVASPIDPVARASFDLVRAFIVILRFTQQDLRNIRLDRTY